MKVDSSNAFGLLPEEDSQKIVDACLAAGLGTNDEMENLLKLALKARLQASLIDGVINGDLAPREIFEDTFTFSITEQGETTLPVNNPNLYAALKAFEADERAKN